MKRCHILLALCDVALGNHRRIHTFFIRALDDLVIDIGEVLGERDLVAARDEPATNHIEADERAGIADVDVVVDRGAAHIHADLAGLDGLELFLFMGSAVVDTHSLLLNGFL